MAAVNFLRRCRVIEDYLFHIDSFAPAAEAGSRYSHKLLALFLFVSREEMCVC